ncbi:hypothetical protein D3C73_1203370 [compost metagenome]
MPVSVRAQRQPSHRVQLLPEAHQTRNEIRAALKAGGGHRHLPALVLLAQQQVLRHEDIFKKHFAEFGVTRHLADGFHPHARAAHIHQQKAQTLVLGRGGVRARQHEAPLRAVGKRRPYLVAVDAVAARHRFGARAHRGQVGPGPGF